MEASAPPKNKCVIAKCDNEFEDYKDNYMNEFVENAKIDFPNVADCKLFLSGYKTNPKSVFNICHSCLTIRRNKWKLNNIENNIKPKREKSRVCNLQLSGKMRIVCRRIILCLIAILLGHYVYGFLATDSNNNTLKSTFKISDLKDKFPSLQLKLLKKLEGAFNRLKTPGEPIVFLLLHDDSNKITTDCLASCMSIMAKRNIFTNSTKSLLVNASEWTPYSDAENGNFFYDKLIKPLRENEVLVLENLQDLPWSLAATSLHFLCDSENPKISKAMYLLQLRVNRGNGGLQQLTEREKMETAEQAMTTAWTDMPISFRAPLITRLTSYVDAVLLKSNDECSVPECFPLGDEEWFIKISP